MKDMKKCYLDANTLIYWQDTASHFNQEAKELLEKLVKENYQPFISPLVLDEYIHNSIRFSGKKIIEIKKNLHQSLKKIFLLPKLQLINPPLLLKAHLEIIYLMCKYDLHTRDAYHLLTIKENKIKFMATFDSDFKIVFQKGLVKQFK